MDDSCQNGIHLRCLILILLGFLKETSPHSCGHKSPQVHEVTHDAHIEPFHIMRKRSVSQQLRIQVEYDSSVKSLPTRERQLVQKNVIPVSVDYWQRTLLVRQTTGPIRLIRQCSSGKYQFKENDPYPYCHGGCQKRTYCGEIAVPEHHLEPCRMVEQASNYKVEGVPGNGVDDADFVLYVSAFNTSRCDMGSTVAYAAYCQLENSMDRPIAGYVNMCPHAISLHNHDLHQMYSTIKHEILHALGFTAGLYAFFRDEYGNPLTKRHDGTGKPPFNQSFQMYQWSDKIVKTVIRPAWKVNGGYVAKEVSMIVTPNVVREVRAHFNCSTLEGAELEDQGIPGTTLTHWEKRVFENEVMTGTFTQNPVISRVTLALMEDTGWYKVDYNNAESLAWGKNLGCNFVKESCLQWMDRKREKGESIHPFCNHVRTMGLQLECTENLQALALCNLRRFDTPLDKEYQHFTEIPGIKRSEVPYYGGSVVLADYCPYTQEFTWNRGGVAVRGSRCDMKGNNADDDINVTFERYGPQSKCFEHSAPWTIFHCNTPRQVEHWGSGCYEYSCNPSLGLIILVADIEYLCYHAGYVIHIKARSKFWLHEGTIVCPRCELLCPNINCPKELARSSQVLQSAPASLSIPCSATELNVHHFLLFIHAFFCSVILHQRHSSL